MHRKNLYFILQKGKPYTPHQNNEMHFQTLSVKNKQKKYFKNIKMKKKIENMKNPFNEIF